MQNYVGKYRAIVVDVKDPEKRGRIKVNCPKVYGDDKSPWCQPCLSYAIDKAGDFIVPKLNDFVWIEFEEGDVRYPIYTGGLWAKEKTPLEDYTKVDKFRQIEFEGCKITIEKKEDGSKEVIITNGTASITMNKGDIKIKGTTVKIEADRIDLN